MHKFYRVVWSQAKSRWTVARKALGQRAGQVLVFTALLGVAPAWALEPGALPTGGQITAGQGSISQSGNSLNINQLSDRLIANWSTFNIGSDASVRFQQPGSSSVALNRIFDQNPSQIFGALSANGQVFLLNPSGIVFGASARVDVGGLVASSLNLSDEDFMAGKFGFSGAGGAVINRGAIRTADGGYVAFLSPCVQNEGSITAPNGNVSLAAGSKINLDFSGDKLVNFTIDQGIIDALIENKGLIKADDGTVYLSARAADRLTSAVINQSGVIEAKGLNSRGGRIVLDADQTTVSGALDASSAAGQGGTVIATGERVLLKSGAHLNASGATGGGEVLVGGSWQGKDAGIRQATGTVIEKGAKLEANATVKGDGGTVVAWSDTSKAASVTRAYGTFEAKGGANGGNGGRIETSGHWLDIAGATGSAAAAYGRAGEWLLDPYNVTITGANASGAWGSAGGTDTWTPSANSSTIWNIDINSKLEAGTNVTVTTTGVGTQIGDITVDAAIAKASGASDVTLTLKAANSIVVNQAISNSGGAGKLNVVLDADNNNGTGDGAGIVMLNADIVTGGGSLSFGTGRTATIGGVNTLVGGDVFVGGAGARTLSINGGTIDVNGEMIVANTDGLTINSSGTSHDGDVHFWGLLNSGNQYTFVDKTGSAGTGSWSAARTEAINGTGGGSAVGDSYLVNITSRLENSVAVRAAGYKGVWIGAWRPNGTTGAWKWATGPEANQQFFTQNPVGGGGTTASGYYSNFGLNEPNGSFSPTPSESVGQFFGTAAQWNDLADATHYSNAADPSQYAVMGFVKETNLAASPVTINAGSGTVTFDGAVGASKALASLTVSASSAITFNSGVVTTTAAGCTGALNLTSTGNINGLGAVTVGGATSLSADSGNITLANIANNFSGVVSVVSGANVSIVDSNALSLGAVSASGTVAIATMTGDLSLTGAVSTTNATTSAIKLNAGKSAAAGTAAGGNIIVSGGSLTTGAGGRATLYSGSVSGSSGLTGLIGAGSGRFRYNSDESADNYVTGLATGSYAVYRERPTLTITSDGAITYGDSPSLTTTYNSLNGDTLAQAISGLLTTTVGGALSSSGNYTAVNHTVTTSGGTSRLGYSLSYAAGNLAVSQRGVSLSGATARDKIYNGSVVAIVDGGSVSGLVAGDSVSAAYDGANFDSASVGQNKPVTVALTLSGADASNYMVVQPGLTADILPDQDAGKIDSQTGGERPTEPAGPAIEPNTGSAGLGAIINANLVIEPAASGASMVLTSASQSEPVSFSASAGSVILGVGNNYDGGNLQDVGTLAVFVSGGGSAESLGNFTVRENASAISMTATGRAAGSVPAAQDLVAKTTATFSLELEGGASIECQVGLSSAGVLVISVPGGGNALDMRQLAMMGMQVLRQDLKQNLGQIKSVMVLTATGSRI